MSFRRVWTCLLLAVPTLASLPLTADDLPAWTPIGPDGGYVRTLATSPARPGWIFAGLRGSGHGLFRSTNRGAGWAAVAGQQGRSVLDLAIDADGRVFYAATDAGLQRSTDGGATWSFLDPGGSDLYTLVEAHPRRPGLVFAVRAGVLLRSTDGGVTREAVEGPEGIRTLRFSTAGPRVVGYAGAVNGLWKSTDAGLTWRRLDTGYLDHVHSIAVDPRNPQVLWAGLLSNRRVLLKSTDGGATWTLSQRGLPLVNGSVPTVGELAVDPASSSLLYAVVGERDLFRSVNAGRNWTRVSSPPGAFLNDLEAVGYGLLAGTPAGVFLSTDRGLTWQIRTSGMLATSITGLAIDRQDPPRLYAGDANAGVFKTVHRGRPWLRLGDIPEPFAWARPLQIDPEDPQTVYAATTGAVAKSTNGGRRWTLHGDLSCVAVLDLLLDPRETSRLYAGGRFYTSACGLRPDACTFYRSLDAGETWQCVPDNEVDFARPLGVDPFTSAVYAQPSRGHLLRSTDAGTTWTVLFENLSAASFAASPLVPGTLWAGGEGKVRRSRDGGLTWQDFSTGLPAGLIVELAPDPADAATLYAAAAVGVFKSTDAGETWSPAGIWPSNIAFLRGLVVDPVDTSILYAGTDGFGVLRLDQEGD